MSADVDDLKRLAAVRAVEYVRDGMNVGLGTGSTTTHAIRELGERVKAGLRIVGVPTSERTARLALDLGIPLTTLEECPRLDMTIDGADEVHLPTMHVLKGLGGALLREKIVALATDTETLIVDETKIVERLGERAPVPVEVVTFGWSRACAALADLGCRTERRQTSEGAPYVTDSGNYLIDCHFPGIGDPRELAKNIKSITGVVEHGIFVDIACRVIIASDTGIRVVGEP